MLCVLLVSPKCLGGKCLGGKFLHRVNASALASTWMVRYAISSKGQEKNSRLYIIGFGLCIKGGKPEKGVKIWHFFVNFIYKQADRGFATSRLRSDADGTYGNMYILAHNYSTRFGLVNRKRGECSAGSG